MLVVHPVRTELAALFRDDAHRTIGDEQIEPATGEMQTQILFEVIDTGIGISKESQKKLAL